MTPKQTLIVALLVLGGSVLAQQQIRDQEGLEEEVTLYWTAFVEHDYVAAYEMYPAYARSAISYFEWLEILGLREDQQGGPGLRLASVEIESITQPDDPNFSHMCEVFVRLRLETHDGSHEDALVPNVWEMDDDGNWTPSMPVALGQ